MKIIPFIEAIYKQLNSNKDLLNELDATIGDGDHGTNICRGFSEIIKNKSIFAESTSLPADLMQCATILMSKIGGSSGPLFGSAFMQMSIALKGQNQIDNAILATCLTAALNDIKSLGKVQQGEKTMIDALIPAIEEFKKAKPNDPLAFKQAAIAAQKGYESTLNMKATKGRASYLGDRSIGHCDPGALSIALIFKGLSEIYNG